MTAKSNKRKPANDPGYLVNAPCPCGGKIRTWVYPSFKDYVDDDGNPVRHGERVAKCFTCWNDKTGMVAELIARGQR